MKLRNNRPRRAAFTLIEMMVVVAIIVALAGVGVFYMIGQVDESNKAKARADIKSIEQAITAYKLHHLDGPNGGWPDSFDLLFNKDERGHGPYLTSAEAVLDPWGKRFQYDVAGGNNRNLKPDIFTTAPDGVIIGNWTTK